MKCIVMNHEIEYFYMDKSISELCKEDKFSIECMIEEGCSDGEIFNMNGYEFTDLKLFWYVLKKPKNIMLENILKNIKYR